MRLIKFFTLSYHPTCLDQHELAPFSSPNVASRATNRAATATFASPRRVSPPAGPSPSQSAIGILSHHQNGMPCCSTPNASRVRILLAVLLCLLSPCSLRAHSDDTSSSFLDCGLCVAAPPDILRAVRAPPTCVLPCHYHLFSVAGATIVGTFVDAPPFQSLPGSRALFAGVASCCCIS